MSTIITINHGGDEVTIDTNASTAVDVLRRMVAAMVAIGFHAASVEEAVCELADEIQRPEAMP